MPTSLRSESSGHFRPVFGSGPQVLVDRPSLLSKDASAKAAAGGAVLRSAFSASAAAGPWPLGGEEGRTSRTSRAQLAVPPLDIMHVLGHAESISGELLLRSSYLDTRWLTVGWDAMRCLVDGR